jgi:1-deoxy-D-xylulose-5-phosphate synthase
MIDGAHTVGDARDVAAETGIGPCPAGLGESAGSSALDGIERPGDLRGLDRAALQALAAEIRAFLVQKVCAAGGHLGVNLGVVELTLAAHKVFDSPRDVLLFDTGHQAYVHKLLTGRRADFGGLRRRGGLSGYPSRAESRHDWIENSHASTVLAYADGVAKALRLRGELAEAGGSDGRHVVAVIGDGAMTGGLAWEGINNLASASDRSVVILLNDNARSYDPTVGGLAAHLATLRSRADGRADGVVAEPTIFEQLGIGYIGPVDGHDCAALEAALVAAKCSRRTVLVHAVTAKGRGWEHAETDAADRMHGVGPLDPMTGRPVKAVGPSWTGVFGREIAEIGAVRPDVVCISAAMRLPVGLGEFSARYPDRFFDVGIAEQQAVCSAAGLAMSGFHPVVALYSTFLNRAFDQVLLDVALHRLPVTFVLDRAGVTGPDGPSHHGMWDTSILACVPGIRVAAPRDPARLREALREAVEEAGGPTVIRFPKAGAGPDLDAVARMDGFDVLRRGRGLPLDVLIVAAGITSAAALEAAVILHDAGYGVTVVDPRWILPIHPAVVRLAARHRLAVTLEDAGRVGGFGAAYALACQDAAVATPVRAIGLPAQFLPHGDRDELLAEAALSGPSCARAIGEVLARM